MSADTPPKLVWTGTDGQLYVGTRGEALRLSWSARDFDTEQLGVVILPAEMGGPRLFAQPCFDPGRTRVAAYALPVGSVDDEGTPVLTGGGSAYVFDVDGLNIHRVFDMDERGPVYLSWRPDGGALRMVLQDDESLQLLEVDLDEGQAKLLAAGSPLFHSPHPDGRILVHTGGDARADREAALALLDPSVETRQTMSTVPGTFPTAAWHPSGTRIAYAMAGDGLESAIVFSGLRGEDLKAVYTFDGRAGFQWRPDGNSLLMARGDDTELHYEELVEIFPDGSFVPLHAGSFVAFHQSPHGIVMAELDELTELIEFRLLSAEGTSRTLFSMVQTNETRFAAHFFDQFQVGHPQVSPCGRWFCACGYPATGIEVDRSEPPQLLVQDLTSADEPLVIADAVFAAFAPSAE